MTFEDLANSDEYCDEQVLNWGNLIEKCQQAQEVARKEGAQNPEKVQKIIDMKLRGFVGDILDLSAS